ncbi:hypothetical protein ACFVGN_28835 [Streptomyces sp. NPDC057757]|uniref:hypothetical protein n=1 Tax=Streptomyces sp. NPDC057757 TaxID=3346241 RepID=UPI0036803DE2
MVSSRRRNCALTVQIQLYDAQGILLDETNGLAEIRRLIAEDRVPIRSTTSS